MKQKLLTIFCTLFIGLQFFGQSVITIGTGVAGATGVNYNPIYRSSATSSFDYSRAFYLFTAAELAAAGLPAGATITQVEWDKSNTGATVASTANVVFNIFMNNTSLSSYATSSTWGALNTGATLVYNNNNQVIPATTGFLPFTLTTPYIYNGNSLEISTDWDISAVSGSPTTAGFTFLFTPAAGRVGGNSSGSPLSAATLMGTQANRPNIRITFTPPPACSGAPNSGTANISASTGCANVPFSLSATGLSAASGLAYQWYSAPSASGPWTSIPTATSSAFTTSASAITFYQMETTCTVSALSATTSITSFTPTNCNFMSTTTLTTCSGLLYDSGGPSATYQNSEDYTLTIVPSTSGAMAQLNFNNFTVETCCDYLQIYDGTSTSAQLIGQYTTLPPAITATNATGALTLRFFSDGSVVQTGFEANISCFIPPTCSGAPNSGTAAISSATACLSTGVTLSGTGITTGMGISYQWFSGPSATGPWASIPNATLAVTTLTASTVTFYQLVTTCSVSALSATSSAISYSPSNCFTMSNTTITTCSGTLYDSGGPTSNYQNSENYTLTIVPSTSGAMAQLNFINFTVETCCDYLQIYDGTSTSAQLIGQYTTLPPAITATNASGALTLRFFSDGSVVQTGFEANISCYIPPTCSGAPNSGTATISSATACLSTGVTLSGTGITTGMGISYQWFSGPSATGPWTSIPNATLAVTTLTASNVTFYQLVTTCSVSALSATSSAISYSPSNCFTMSNTTITTCSGTLYDSGGPNNDYQSSEDYTLTIVPSTSGAMAQLNFLNFNIETCCDLLEIYDGNSTSAQLIGSYTTLPPAITATNATGALTLRFTSDGSVEYSGFEANISCYIPPTCSGAPNSGTAAISSATACQSTGVTLSGTGITTGMGISYQWFSGPSATGPWTSIPNATLAVTTLTASTVTFYQIVTTCSVSALSATSSAISYSPSNCFTMSNTTITTCSGTIYDTGGPNNAYQSSEDYTLTILPATPGASVQLTFLNFAVETCCDYLQIYDGNSTSGPLIGQYTALPPAITATNATGALTLRFFSDISITNTGFEAVVNCTTSCTGPPSAPAVTSASICSGNAAVLNATVVGTANWYSSATSTAYIATGSTFTTPILTSNITYYVKDSSVCGISPVSAVNVTVITTPTLAIAATNTVICIGSNVTLTASGSDTFTWSTTSTNTSIVVSPTVNTSYTLTGYATECNITQTASINIVANPNPTVTLSTGGVSTICVSNGSIALVGSPNGGVYSGIGVTGNLQSIANAGTFTPVYSYTDAITGCSSAATTTIIVANCTGINTLVQNSNELRVYPNPNNGSFNIETTASGLKTIEITDLSGRLIISEKTDATSILMNINHLDNGIYQVKVKTENGVDVIKIIKQ